MSGDVIPASGPEAHPWAGRLGVWWIAEDHPDATAIAEAPDSPRLSYRQLTGRAHQAARALQTQGLAPGDIVAYVLPNGVEMIVWQLACFESGLRSLALNPALSTGEIKAVLDHSGAAVLVVDAASAERAQRLGSLSGLRLRIVAGGDIPGFERSTDLLSAQAPEPPERRVLGGPIQYSSGTTGQPKGIFRPLPDDDPDAFADKMKIFGRGFRFLPFDGAHLVSAGMAHGGCEAFYHGALNVGQPLVIAARFDPEDVLRLIEAHRVTTAYMVPTQFVRLLRLPPEVRARYDVSSLGSVVHAAAPCPVDVKHRILDWWGPVIWETYGGTEGPATIVSPRRWLERPGTVGRAIPGVTIRILDDDGRPLPSGTVGHVFIEPSAPAFQYHRDPAQTAAAFRGRAFTIGDVGWLDDDGYLFLCDRAKDMIIRGGINIYPAEVEAVLQAHPAVHDAGVIGVPDDEWGEEVQAFVELAPGVEPGEELAAELIRWCQDRLARFKCPRRVAFVPELPRTDSGKLLKRRLREGLGAEATDIIS